ncbi:MAG: hypothetical protein VKI42_06580 [Synechococcaceae cyanobacterium]|nr:hypothetical protein [Synechococcaceae cyanobacterium]
MATGLRAGLQQGLVQPSVVVPQARNLMFNPLHPAMAEVVLPQPQAFALDWPAAPVRGHTSPFLSGLQVDRHSWLSWPSAEPAAVQVNMLDANSQLSRLMKAALAGEEVIIASHGKAQVKLVPCASPAGLKRLGALAAASPVLLASQVDAAFAEPVDQQVAELFNS